MHCAICEVEMFSPVQLPDHMNQSIRFDYPNQLNRLNLSKTAQIAKSTLIGGSGSHSQTSLNGLTINISV